jgi:hypothetical protein
VGSVLLSGRLDRLDRLGEEMLRFLLALLGSVLLHLLNDWGFELSRALLVLCPVPLGLGNYRGSEALRPLVGETGVGPFGMTAGTYGQETTGLIDECMPEKAYDSLYFIHSENCQRIQYMYKPIAAVLCRTKAVLRCLHVWKREQTGQQPNECTIKDMYEVHSLDCRE